MYAYSVVHVVRYLQQKTEAQNDFVMSSYKHSFNCAIFWTFFYRNIVKEIFFHIFKDISVHNSAILRQIFKN